MFKEGLLDKILRKVKKMIPKSVFDFFAPVYHAALAYIGAVIYGFPSRSMKVIGVTGTKGKSTTVFLITKILEEVGEPVATIGSLGFKIRNKEWPNTLKMTMPGRFKLQKFLAEHKADLRLYFERQGSAMPFYPVSACLISLDLISKVQFPEGIILVGIDTVLLFFWIFWMEFKLKISEYF